MRRNIVMIGMMGAGKTAIGGELARRLHRPFADTDAEIERAAAMSIPEIFARDGEEFFRARESEVLGRVLATGNSVVSTGGGAWLRPENRARIGESGVSVWLDCDLETLWHRVRQRPRQRARHAMGGARQRMLHERARRNAAPKRAHPKHDRQKRHGDQRKLDRRLTRAIARRNPPTGC